MQTSNSHKIIGLSPDSILTSRNCYTSKQLMSTAIYLVEIGIKKSVRETYKQICQHYNFTRGDCFPSYARLSKLRGISTRTICNHVAVLIKAGIITARKCEYFDFITNRAPKTNLFRICTGKLDEIIHQYDIAEEKRRSERELYITHDLRENKERVLKFIENKTVKEKEVVTKAVVRDSKSVQSTTHTTEAILSRFATIESCKNINSKDRLFLCREYIKQTLNINCRFALDDQPIATVNVTGLFYTGTGSNLNSIGYVTNSHGHIYVLKQVIKELSNASDKGSDNHAKVMQSLNDELITAMSNASRVSMMLRG